MTASGAPARGPERGQAAGLALFALLAIAVLGCGGSTNSPAGGLDGGASGGRPPADGSAADGSREAGVEGTGGRASGGSTSTGGSTGIGSGGSASGGAPGSGGNGGALGCVTTIQQLVVPEAGPNAKVRVRGVPSNPGPETLTLKWSVTSPNGQDVAWSAVGDDSTTIEFPATLAGSYEVIAFTASGRPCPGRRPVAVMASCSGCFRFRVMPPAIDGVTVPMQEKNVNVDVIDRLQLDPRTRLGIAPRDLMNVLVPSYVRVISPESGLMFEGDTRRALETSWLMNKPYDVLVVPFNGAKAPQLFSPANGLQNFVIDDGIFVLGKAVDGQGNDVENVQVLLRAGTRPSTIGRSDPRGNFSLQARFGTLSGVIAPPTEAGLPEVHVKVDANNPGIMLNGLDRTLRIEWAPVVQAPLSVAVTTAAGSAVAGARVWLESPTELPGVAKVILYAAAEAPLQAFTSSGAVRLEGNTDPGGVAVFPAVPVGSYRIIIMPPAGTTAGVLTTTNLTKTAGAQSQGIVLAGAVTLKGTLTPAGATAGARIVARDQGIGLVADDVTTVVDASGAFSLRLAPNRSYHLVAEPPPLAKGVFARTVLGSAIAVDATPVQTLASRPLSSGRACAMTVASGEMGLGGYSVQVFCPSSSARCLDPSWPVAEAFSDASGRFTVTLPVAEP